MLSKKQIEARVNSLLDRYGLTKPPIDVETLASQLGAEIVLDESDDDVSGAILQRGRLKIIAVNASHHIHRRRFTIAHELGHLVLHGHGYSKVEHRQLPANQDMPDIRFRDNESAAATDPDEIEANRFAAALLMPIPFLQRDLDDGRLRIPVNSQTISDLASRYRVSKQAMTLRLSNLGLPIDSDE